jgi:anti-sigma regulatory factor (Ser/Thr protein kinase)
MSVHAVHEDQQVGFRHKALFYAGADDFLAGTLRFLREGIERDEPAIVVVAPDKIAALQEALGDDARHVRFEDMRRIGTNPARIIPAWKDFVDAAGGSDRPLRGIGEPIWAERSAEELVECHRHESLLNLAFADAAHFRLLCPYDTTALAPEVVAEARRTHPLVTEDGSGISESPCFHGVEAAAAPWSTPLTPAPTEPEQLTIDASRLGLARAVVTRWATRFGLAPARVEDLVLAVNELATNSVVHGGGSGTLRLWEGRVAGGDGVGSGALVCEVTDHGQIHEPLSGRARPARGQIGQFGLWLVNQLCDFVEQRTLPDGNVVRVTMRRDV